MNSAFEHVPYETPIVNQMATRPGVITIRWLSWFQQIRILFANGFTGTVATAKLTSTGLNGSMTFINGVLTTITQAT